ncbi:MAG: serine protease AprX, partial [Acidimicrobiaceae bacterium]|nr:serine protease AprX [Acidimicrobiaceae bacterium]
MTGATVSLSRRTLAVVAAAALAIASLALPAQGGERTASAPRAATATATAAAAVDSALTNLRHGVVKVIVQKHHQPAATTQPTATQPAAGAQPAAPAPSSGPTTPEQTVANVGGHVTHDLPIIDGFAATLPAAAIPDLAANPEVRAISLDRVMTVQGSGTSNPTTPKSVYRKAVRADSLNSAGYSGRGVTVALIDTGVSGVSDLAGRILPVTDDITGAVTACQNMSGESTCDDSFGHGTFVAGVIAGNGAASNGAYKGVAPEANILSVKIAGRSGAADVSNVLAAIQWVVSFKDRYGIKVLNLSLGTDSTQSYRVDPLDYAVEKAWRSGIVVVVSASNRGPDPSTIAKPGDDPFVITVGAIDDRGTNGLNDDLLPNFTSRGPTAADGLAKPDLVAPGAHVVSLRSPGSAVDEQFPNYVDGSYRKGSGTS